MQAEINLVWEHLLPALRGQAKGDAKLKEKLAALALTLPAGQPKSATASRISGKSFTIDDNALKVIKVSLTFADDRCDFVMTDAQGDHKVSCGLGNWITAETDLSPAPLHLVTTGITDGKSAIGGAAAWKDDKTLVMHWQFLETPHYQLVNCTFDGDSVKVEFKRSLSLSGKDPRPVLTGKLG